MVNNVLNQINILWWPCTRIQTPGVFEIKPLYPGPRAGMRLSFGELRRSMVVDQRDRRDKINDNSSKQTSQKRGHYHWAYIRPGSKENSHGVKGVGYLDRFFMRQFLFKSRSHVWDGRSHLFCSLFHRNPGAYRLYEGVAYRQTIAVRFGLIKMAAILSADSHEISTAYRPSSTSWNVTLEWCSLPFHVLCRMRRAEQSLKLENAVWINIYDVNIVSTARFYHIKPYSNILRVVCLRCAYCEISYDVVFLRVTGILVNYT